MIVAPIAIQTKTRVFKRKLNVSRPLGKMCGPSNMKSPDIFLLIVKLVFINSDSESESDPPNKQTGLNRICIRNMDFNNHGLSSEEHLFERCCAKRFNLQYVPISLNLATHLPLPYLQVDHGRGFKVHAVKDLVSSVVSSHNPEALG
jgi:hypothetical protein